MLLSKSAAACKAPLGGRPARAGVSMVPARIPAAGLTAARRAARVVSRVASVERPGAKVDRGSLDPISEAWSSEEHVPGQIWTVHSPEQLQAAVDKHADQLTVLMCKSKTCRPCKSFMKKYMAAAQRFPNVLHLQIFGDESPETRKLMVKMKVKVTPTFALYRGGRQVNSVTGVFEAKLLRAMVDAMTKEELEGREEDLAEIEALEKEAAANEAAKH